ncbi:hypothetical protein D3C81_1898990 [compost metagenome]
MAAARRGDNQVIPGIQGAARHGIRLSMLFRFGALRRQRDADTQPAVRFVAGPGNRCRLHRLRARKHRFGGLQRRQTVIALPLRIL